MIEEPSVTLVTVQGQAMYQIAGGRVSEAVTTAPAETVPLESDVQLVAQQTGRSVEEARKALAEAGGDLAKAILTLKGQLVELRRNQRRFDNFNFRHSALYPFQSEEVFTLRFFQVHFDIAYCPKHSWYYHVL